MLSNENELQRCKQLIEQKLDWGASQYWTSADFEALQQRILDETGVSLSASTLRRIWGRVDYQHLPSTTTLNILAQFAGYTDWRQFVRAQTTRDMADVAATSVAATEVAPADVALAKEAPLLTDVPLRSINWRRWGWVAGLLVIVATAITIVAFEQKQQSATVPSYHFSSKPITRGIPTSVVFTYDASASPIDSVFIQQSWDPRRREVVDKNGQTHTSIYYEPGFYHAKLLVGDRVVKEHPLLIPTDGWLGTITTTPVPIYLKPSEYVGPQHMRLPIAAIQQKNVALQPMAPLVKYFNVGNFKPVPVGDFVFSSALKNEYSEGAAVCQHSWVVLITDDMPISIPLSTKGCVSELMLMDGSRSVSGKSTDLSGLGVDFSDWVRVGCHSDGQKLYYTVNDKVAYTTKLPTKKVSIVGVMYGFRGTGAVKDIRLQVGGKTVFSVF